MSTYSYRRRLLFNFDASSNFDVSDMIYQAVAIRTKLVIDIRNVQIFVLFYCIEKYRSCFACYHILALTLTTASYRYNKMPVNQPQHQTAPRRAAPLRLMQMRVGYLPIISIQIFRHTVHYVRVPCSPHAHVYCITDANLCQHSLSTAFNLWLS